MIHYKALVLNWMNHSEYSVKSPYKFFHSMFVYAHDLKCIIVECDYVYNANTMHNPSWKYIIEMVRDAKVGCRTAGKGVLRLRPISVDYEIRNKFDLIEEIGEK